MADIGDIDLGYVGDYVRVAKTNFPFTDDSTSAYLLRLVRGDYLVLVSLQVDTSSEYWIVLNTVYRNSEDVEVPETTKEPIKVEKVGVRATEIALERILSKARKWNSERGFPFAITSAEILAGFPKSKILGDSFIRDNASESPPADPTPDAGFSIVV